MLEEFEKRRKVRAITVSTNDGEVNIIIISVKLRIYCRQGLKDDYSICGAYLSLAYAWQRKLYFYTT